MMIGQLSRVSSGISSQPSHATSALQSESESAPKRTHLNMSTVREHVSHLDENIPKSNDRSIEAPIDRSINLRKFAERTYRRGQRSPELINLLHSAKLTPIPMRTVTSAAEYIVNIWESLPEERSKDKIVALTNYIAVLLHRLSPSVITLLLATYYLGQLKRLYPTAVGSTGCTKRLITTALLIAYRYHEHISPISTAFYRIWATATLNVIDAPSLQRMELELVYFLKFKLYVSQADFEYFVDRVFNHEGQVVPRCLDIAALTRPILNHPYHYYYHHPNHHSDRENANNDKDAAVPETLFVL